MNQRAVILKAVLVLMLVWGVIWGIRAYAGSRKVTADSVEKEIHSSGFADFSAADAPPPAIADERESRIREVADKINRLDFNERQRNRDSRVTEEFFRSLSAKEKNLFLDLTVMKSMSKFMQALDAMPAEQRKKFVEQGLREIEEGKTEEDIKRAQALGDDVLAKITAGGMRAYFQNSNAETKLDLAPLMEAMNDVMQGMRGNEFGPPR